MKKILFLLLAAISLTACDKGDDAPKTITGYDHGLLNQTCYADQTNGAGDFTFTAAENWTTQITDVTRTASDIWITLDPSHGGAGTVKMKITLAPNLTGKDRKATIKIVCGDTTITITIEQKGTTQSGDKPGDPDPDPDPLPGKYITRIDVEDAYINEYSGTEYTTFRYDEEMLAEMITTETESYKGVLQHTWVTTTSIGQISGTGTPSIGFTTEECVDGGSPRLLVDGIAQFGNGFENGRVTSCSASGTDYDKTETGVPWSNSFRMFYDTNGYLVRTERAESHDPAETYNLTWSGGNYTKVAWGDGYIDEAIYANSTYKNKANLDLNAFIVLDSEGFDFSFGEPEKILALCGYTGKKSANLATKVTERLPGSTEATKTYTYEFDADGYPVRICARDVSGNSETIYKITYNK